MNDFLVDNVSIGIATCNRWNDLRVTLQGLRDFGLGEVETVVVDDCSTEPCPESLQADFPLVRIEREAVSRGSVAVRNLIATRLSRRYWLHIDDDSHPVAGSLEEAVLFMQGHPDVACLALNLIERRAAPTMSLETPPWQAQRFIGCAVLLQREIFLKLEGYRESLYHMGEEGDLCARALGRGYTTFNFPGLVIRHHRSLSHRSHRRISYYQGRNRWLLAWWNFPMPYLLKKFVFCLPGTLSLVDVRHFPVACAGFCNGLMHGLQTWRLRRPMAPEIYRKWESLPWKSED